MQISTGLPRSALRTLEAPEVATRGEYRLLHATKECSKPVTDSQQDGKQPRVVLKMDQPAHQSQYRACVYVYRMRIANALRRGLAL